MRNGKIEQIGTPFEIYNKPATSYVASFIGTLNLLEATVVDADNGIVSIGSTNLKTASSLDTMQGKLVKLTVRPEALSFANPAGSLTADTNVLSGTIDTIKFLGSTVRYVMKFGDTFMYMDRFNNPQLELPKRGDAISVVFSKEACRILPADQESPAPQTGAEEEL
jgi:putative spermidine/putrescine transport system ATP-binding protein